MSDSEENDELEQNDNVQDISVFRKREKIDLGDNEQIEPEYLKKLNHMLTCPICLDLFTDPVYVKGCSHRFCRDCIEKAIRSSKMKQCPTCRKTIGTKRMLRLDHNVQQIMKLIYGDVQKYLAEKSLNENLMIEKYYKENGLVYPDVPSGLKKRRKAAERESKLEDDFFEQERQSPLQSRVKGKRNNAQSQFEQEFIPKISNFRSQKYNEEEQRQSESEIIQKKLKKDVNKEVLENQSLQASELKDIQPMLISLQIKVIPYESLTKQYDFNVSKLDWRLNLADITKMICSQLGINLSKYSPYIKFYTKSTQGDSFYHLLENRSQRIKSIEESYWAINKRQKYMRGYSEQEQLRSGKEEEKKQQVLRVLYYSIEIQDLPELQVG